MVRTERAAFWPRATASGKTRWMREGRDELYISRLRPSADLVRGRGWS
jgi:hypothetical protein